MNETATELINQTPIFNNWNQVIADLINSFFGTTLEGNTIIGLLPSISLFLLAWKWHTVLGFLQTYGMFVIIAIAFYTGGKALGFL